MAEIVLDAVSKVFADGTVAVDRVDLTVADGELLVLVGPSGCGKSTLLAMIAGLETITDGTVRIGGRLANRLEPGARNLAMVFQSYALYPHLTVRGNLLFPLETARLPAAERRDRVERAAAMLDIGELLDRRPASLSGGQRQRVAIGRAIVREPDAFLMDEPLSNLDAALRLATRAELAELQRRLAATMLYVTHDQVEAMTLGHRVAVMRSGRIEQVDEPRRLYERPQTLSVAAFIGSPRINLVPAIADDGRLRLPFADAQAVPSPLRLPDGPVVVGVRPEHIGLAADRGVFRARVALVEWLGAEAFVHLEPAFREPPRAPALDPEPGTARLIARVDPGKAPAAGSTVAVTLAHDRLHLFDARSGRRID